MKPPSPDAARLPDGQGEGTWVRSVKNGVIIDGGSSERGEVKLERSEVLIQFHSVLFLIPKMSR